MLRLLAAFPSFAFFHFSAHRPGPQTGLGAGNLHLIKKGISVRGAASFGELRAQLVQATSTGQPLNIDAPPGDGIALRRHAAPHGGPPGGPVDFIAIGKQRAHSRVAENSCR